MSFVPGYEFDLFISYAHVDDTDPFCDGPGWVSELTKAIEKSLAQDLGRREFFTTYFDKNSLRGHHRLPGISDKVRSSAVMVVVLSNGYLASEFCIEDELNVFLERGAHAADSIYVIRMSPIHDSYEEPTVLKCIKGCQFWGFGEGKRPLTFGLHRHKDESYFQKATSTASDLADMLRDLKKTAQAPAVSAKLAQGTGGRVFDKPLVHLAEVTDDLDVERDQVKSYLGQFGFNVRPLAAYPRPGFASALSADLSQCSAFIQLLSHLPGKRLEDEAPRGFPWLQVERAKALGMPIFQWRSPDLDLNLVDDDQRQLLELATVQATPLAQFQKDVLDRLQAPAAKPNAVEPGSVYIVHDQRDEEQALRVQQELNDEWDVARTPHAGTASTLRSAREKLMLEYESVIFLYGSVKQSWIDRELNAFKAIRSMRAKPPKKQVILVTPPIEKPSPTVMLKGAKELNAQDGLDHRALSELKALLLN